MSGETVEIKGTMLLQCLRSFLSENSKSRGFTLMEILRHRHHLPPRGPHDRQRREVFGGSQTDIAKLFVTQSMRTPLVTYRLHMGGYPSTEEGLAALKTAPPGKTDRWRGPYLDESIKIPILDPWNEPYQYRYPGVHNKDGYDLWSKGPDKTDGTDDDIGNW